MSTQEFSPDSIRGSPHRCVMDYPRKLEHGIMFHHFHNGEHPKGQGSISKEDFENILNFVGVDRILSPREWLKKLEANELDKQHLCMTFDDALLCQFEIALPILEAYNLKAFWFVYSSVFEGHVGRIEIYRFFRSKYFQKIDDFYELFFKKIFASEFSERAKTILKGEEEIANLLKMFPFYSINDVKFRLIRDRALTIKSYEAIMDRMILEYGLDLLDMSKVLWMSNDHLQYLNNSDHVVGLHSYSHPTVLADLSYEEQFEEYVKNYRHIKENCGDSPVAMAHPCNSYNGDTLKILEHLGIRCAFRSNMFPKYEGGRLNPNRFEIARQDHANIMRMLGR